RNGHKAAVVWMTGISGAGKSSIAKAVEKKLWDARKTNVLRIAGCPVSVAEQVLLLVKLGKLKNPYFDPREALGFTSCYLSSRTRNAFARIFGQPYQTAGPTIRGKARPAQNMPPKGADTSLEPTPF
ncbi:MAG: adenylyl-sulfate kinase, partial [Bradymonadaceae bacterium]